MKYRQAQVEAPQGIDATDDTFSGSREFNARLIDESERN
jgi:hypothetical protein